MLHYHTIKNVPGYMPMDDEPPYAYSTLEGARSALVDELKRDEDAYAMADDEGMAEACCAAAEDVNLWSGPDVAYVATDRPHDLGMAYSIVECSELECLEDEENHDGWTLYMHGGYSYAIGDPETFPSVRAACEAWADRQSSNGLRKVDGVYWPTWGGMADDDYAITADADGLTRAQVLAVADGGQLPAGWGEEISQDA